MRGVHVKNQLNSLLKSHFSRPLKNAKIGFSGTSPGFWLKTNFRRIQAQNIESGRFSGSERLLRPKIDL